ncbi:hypothetical protein PHSC3_000131 [Chlamydiales bacterium STE3]|nr:hypothetical protein PHSC3_000131 [Chlamydiales bacterium STE3]
MQKSFFLWVNSGLCFVFLLILSLLVFYSLREENLFYAQSKIVKKVPLIPENPFHLSDQAYRQVQAPALNLNMVAPNLSLPDLRSTLNYYGANLRPDVQKQDQKLFFSFGDPRNLVAVKAGERTYLKVENHSFSLSPSNQPTALWMKAKPGLKNVQVELFLKGVDDRVVREPKEHSQFSLPEKILPPGAVSWMIGSNRVDGTLLFKQKARWRGLDLFLLQYGGPEFSQFQNKQRIDFGEGEGHYSVFVAPGDILIWKSGRWVSPTKGDNTQTAPLLEIKKVDERILNAELWAVEGKNKFALTLVRTPDPIPIIDNSKFHFLATRTKAHYIFDVDGKREIVGPGDWFLMVDGKWKKITKVKEIDQFVERSTVGPLLVIYLSQEHDSKTLKGELFNTSRSDKVEVNIPLLPQNSKKEIPVKPTEEERGHPSIDQAEHPSFEA